jgi:hypothetical protein
VITTGKTTIIIPRSPTTTTQSQGRGGYYNPMDEKWYNSKEEADLWYQENGPVEGVDVD